LKAITDLAVRRSSTTLLAPGAILIVTRSGILRRYLPIAQNTVQVAINQDIKALVPHERVAAEYLLQVLTEQGPTILARCMKAGTTVESIEYSGLKNFAILLPTLPEQTAIAGALSDMDAEITALEQRRDKTRLVKQGMMQELLTGRTRLI
jgi:type I restriction enzyme, S subunit